MSLWSKVKDFFKMSIDDFEMTDADFPNKPPRPGKFVVFTGKDGQFYFNLKAPNGEVIARSEGYTSKQNAYKGIESVREYAWNSNIVEE